MPIVVVAAEDEADGQVITDDYKRIANRVNVGGRAGGFPWIAWEHPRRKWGLLFSRVR
jgi:hypothetical protein